MTSSSHHIWMIHGPTASGKTRLAIDLARALGCEIVNCDSRQLYREMSIGVARPDAEELAEAAHHGIASHSIHQTISAGSYAQWATPIVNKLLAADHHVVIVGGSGLYAKALLYGMDDLPPADQKVRDQLEKRWAENAQGLVDELRDRDPEYATTADLKNPRRVIRAMEVITLTGKSYSSQRTQKELTPRFDAQVHEYAIWPEMDVLDERIIRRTAMMWDAGLPEEADSLKAHAALPAMRTVGYQEFYENPNANRAQLEGLIVTRTRQYAKRQMTWLKKQPNITRIPMGTDASTILQSMAS